MTNKEKKLTEKQEKTAEELTHEVVGQDKSEAVNQKEGEKELQEKEKENENITIPLKDYAAQLEELDDLHQKVDEFSDGWQRERAEFANYRKRVSRDQEQQKQNDKIEVIKKYLVIHDDLERAMKTIPPESVKESWLNGLRLIDQKMKNLLEGEGIAPIPVENIAFNPELHEAISHEENPDFESGQIIEVVQQGYTIGERVIRPALVRVAK